MDDVSYLEPDSINGLNLYAYCANNPISNVDPNGNSWYHWVIGAAIVVGLGIALVVTAGGATGALIALSQVAYGYAASTMATTVLAGAFIGSSLALAGTAAYAMSNSTSFNEFLDKGSWGTVGLIAGGGVIGGASGYLSFANYGHTQFGERTPGKTYPFGRYYNTKDQTITHYGANGKMWWSKHLTDHNKPWAHPYVPHWHAEMPHHPGGGYKSSWELIKELIARIFGGGH